MAIFRLRQGGRRSAAVDAYQFPSALRQRFAVRHGELTSDGVRSVEAATRQWFRIGARHPRARLAVPSVIVDAFLGDFALYNREYAEFCAATYGRTRPPAVAGGDGGLPATFRFAREDEPGAVLPLLFRVDQDLAVVGGRQYLADCGGRGICYELKGTLCLQHLDGIGKAPGNRGQWDLKRTGDGGGSMHAIGGGDGCGAGCGGGN
jgi:hypothetical protein